jgi:glycosyltransferase involved in cell wall biosynthesis
MKCLWLTLADPEPRTNGQYIYSGGLIEALAGSGARLTVVGLARDVAGRADTPQVAWRLAAQAPQSFSAALLSPWPQVASRSRTPAMRQTLASCLAESWDAILFDSIAVGWALDAVLRCQRRRPQTAVVYLSHNHERSVAWHIASHEADLPRRLLRVIDAMKVAWLERRLIRHADLLTANTPDDVAKFAAKPGAAPVALLPPGYGGSRSQRRLDSSVPRRAVIVGSFDWLPKRISLEAFLRDAAPLFRDAGIELQVVGQTEADYLARLAADYPAVHFTGGVPDIRPYLAGARIALVPDLLGGFKLKSLDYVFHRLPIFAMRGAVPGTPLVDGLSLQEFDSHAALARGVAEAMDDLPALNAQQMAAYAACEKAFDWQEIGSNLLHMLSEARRRTGTGTAAGLAKAGAG